MSLVDRTNIDELLPSILCCVGHKGFEFVRGQERGLNPCADNLKYLIRLSKVLECWYPEGDTIQEEVKPYYVIHIEPDIFPRTFTLFVSNGRGGTIVLFNSTASSIGDIVMEINTNTSTTGFTAEANNNNLWIKAPYGYDGIIPTGSLISLSLVGKTVYTNWGFIGGCKEVIAPEPCINNDQIESILEVYKKNCNICATTVTTTSIAPLPG
jgi:hypothetical protein